MENKEALETYNQIIADSNKKLSTLKVLANFFSHAHLIAILIRTKIIHNLFEANKNLDIHKLDLFHLQYTNSLIDLLHKLKKAKEQKYLLINDEIYINDDFITKLKSEIDDSSFTADVKTYNKNITEKISQLYKILESGSNAPFSWNEVLDFSNRRCEEFYRDITEDQFKRITSHEGKKTYQNAHATFEKKLLGRLNIQKFRMKFICGLACGDEALEVFQFVDSNDMFIFINSSRSFYLVDPLQIGNIDVSKNTSNREQIMDQLSRKNSQLREQLSTIKTSMPREVENVLESYLAKISGVDFLDDLQSVDEQTNILKAMLNINIK